MPFTRILSVICIISMVLTLLPETHLFAQQQEGEIIVLSPEVGETIDREERDRYGLFPASVNFYSAVIIKRPDGNYVAEITEEYSGERKVRALPIDLPTLDKLRNRIDNFDELSPAEKTEIRARYEAIREAIPTEKTPTYSVREGIRETVRVSPEQREESWVIVLSPEVGETIDREERDRYCLFPGYQNFFCAVMLQLPDSSYVLEVSEERGRIRRVHTLAIDQQIVDELRRWVERPRPLEIFYAKWNPLILITNRHQQQMEGRFLGLETNTVLLDSSPPLWEPVPTLISIDEIQTITIKKSSGTLKGIGKGIGYGILIGGALGILTGFSMGDDTPGFLSLTAEDKAVIGLFFGGLGGGVLGGAAGAFSGKDEQIDLSQMSQSEKIMKIRILLRLSDL